MNPFTNQPYSDKYWEIYKQRSTLPIWEHKEKFIELLRNNQCLVIVGETGSGKTTQIPQWCVEFCRSSVDTQTKSVVCTQPRRVATTCVATRVAEEMDVAIGEQVGYSIRFDERLSGKTILKYCTEGVLLREMAYSPLLEDFGVVIIDEVHERTLDADVLMGLMKNLINRRSDLKLLVMSATLDYEKFQKYFGNCSLMSVSGRTFPVEISFVQEVRPNYVELAVATVIHIHAFEGAGDILVFLTGEEEIQRACKRIRSEVEKLGESIGELHCIPLYSALSTFCQQSAFGTAPPNRPNGAIGRKCVVSTNIAETSVTIDGVAYVIDCGYSKQMTYDADQEVNSLQVGWISQASALQRSGRAGRTRPGKCFRLYTEAIYKKMSLSDSPEIKRCSMDAVMLKLKKLGIENLVRFDFMDRPFPKKFARGFELLYWLEAIDDNGNLTELGNLMAEFPLEPRLAKMVVASSKLNCSNEIVTIAAMLSASNCFIRTFNGTDPISDLRDARGDHLTLLNVYNEFKKNENCASNWCSEKCLRLQSLEFADEVRAQIVEIMEKHNLQLVSSDVQGKFCRVNITKALIAGFFLQVARGSYDEYYRSREYYTVKGDRYVLIHPSSKLARYMGDWVIYDKLIRTSRTYIQTVTDVEPQWLIEMAPRYFVPSMFDDVLAEEEETEDLRISLSDYE